MSHDRPDPLEISDLLDAAISLPVGDREAFLDRHCRDREEVRDEVESLLSYLPDPDFPEDDGEDETARAERRIGQEFGGFRLVELIAIGGMGAVYRAEQESPRRAVAIKLMRGDMLGADSWRRLRREANALARLDHPAIARIHSAGLHRDPTGPTPYLAMELVEGARPITEWWRSTPRPLRDRLDRFATVCEAIHHGHIKGVLHRDVKPTNLLVDRDDRPKVIDFGVAHVLEDEGHGTAAASRGRIVGTVEYMSPERIEGRGEVDVRSDVYGLGVVLYELLTGRMAFASPSGSLAATAVAISRGDPPPPSTVDRRCRGDLDTIVAKAMAPDPDDRYDSASALAADLRSHLADEPIRARGIGRVAAARKFLRRHRVPVAAAAVVFTALLAGLASSLAAQRETERQLYLSMLSQADLMTMRGDISGGRRILTMIPPGRRREWPVQVLARSCDDSIESAGFGEWNLFRGRMNVDRSQLLASGWGERPELLVLNTSPAGVERRIPLPSLGMGSDWGIPLPDGEPTVIAGLRDGRVVGLKARDGSVVREFARITPRAGGAETDHISDVALSPGGRWLAVGHSSDRVRLIDLLDGSEREFDGFENPAAPNWVFLEWSPDGSTLAVAATGGTFALDAASGRIHRLSTNPSNQASFAPDGMRMATVGSAGGCELIDLATGTVSRVDRPKWPTWGLAWSPDGRWLAIAGRSNSILAVDQESPARVRIRSECNPVWTVCWISEESFMTLPAGAVYSVRAPKLLIMGRGSGTAAEERATPRLQFIDGGREVIACGPDGWIDRVDPLLEARTAIARLPVTAPHADFVPGSETIAVVDGAEPGPIWMVQWREPSVRKIEGEFLGPIAISPDGRRMAVCRSDGDAAIVECASGRIEGSAKRQPRSRTVSFAWLDAQTISWCLPLGNSVVSRAPDGSWTVHHERERSILAAWPRGDGEWYWTDLSSTLKRSERDRLGQDSVPALMDGIGEVLSLAHHPSLPLVAMGTTDGRVMVMDESLGSRVAMFNIIGSRVTDLAWSPDGSMLAGMDSAGNLRFFDSRPLAERWPEIKRRRAEVAAAAEPSG